MRSSESWSSGNHISRDSVFEESGDTWHRCCEVPRHRGFAERRLIKGSAAKWIGYAEADQQDIRWWQAKEELWREDVESGGGGDEQRPAWKENVFVFTPP